MKITLDRTVIKKFFLKKRIQFQRKKLKSNYRDTVNIFYVALSGFLIISFFAILPKTTSLVSKYLTKPQTIENNSKKNFQKVLTGQVKELDLKSDEKKKITFKDLFFDVFHFDDLSSDTVRLSATTLEEIFKETKYSLKEVRENKIVKPISIDLLPNEIKFLESSKRKKELFIKIVLPLILEENNRILLDRRRLFAILNKNKNSKNEKEWLKKRFKQYGVLNHDLTTLKIRMDVIPVSLAIAQAAKETGWGTSRFALEGNALYGQWTWTEDGITPAAAESGATHKVMKFKILKASVRAYQRNLNTHSGYREFREARATQRDNYEKLNSLELVDYLDKYAATGKEYTEILKKIIRQNSLTDFDDAKLLPTSKKLKKLI